MMNTNNNTKTTKFQLETLNCPTCVTKIEGTLNKQDGVKEAKVLFNASKVKVTFDEDITSASNLKTTIEKLGYPVLS